MKRWNVVAADEASVQLGEGGARDRAGDGGDSEREGHRELEAEADRLRVGSVIERGRRRPAGPWHASNELKGSKEKEGAGEGGGE